MIGPLRTVSLDEYRGLVGQQLGTSEWRRIDQGTIDEFARLTGDGQLIHTNPSVAAMTPYGQTIAHGFLVLSLLTAMAYEVVPGVVGTVSGANYGFDRVRFLKPVPSDSKVRGRFTIARFEEVKPGAFRTVLSSTVERLDPRTGVTEDSVVAEWISMAWLA